MRSRRGDAGSATVLVLAGTWALAVVAGLAACIGTVAVARHRAASAADLAALAAASRALDGATTACAAAGSAADAVGAVLETCLLTGDVADVSVAVRPAGFLGSWGIAHSHSRAGPRRR